MTRATINAVAIPSVASGGYNLTDSADFTAIGAAGPGNGVQFTYNVNTIVLLKNGTVNPSLSTIVIGSSGDSITNVGGTVTSPDVSVADGKTHIIKPAAVFKQTDGLMYIDADEAVDVLVLSV